MKMSYANYWGAAVLIIPLVACSQTMTRTALDVPNEAKTLPANILMATEIGTQNQSSTTANSSAFMPATKPINTSSTVTLTTSVRVTAKSVVPLEPVPTSTYQFVGKELLQSAGTFGDLPRFLQTLPGAVGGSDAQNASFVRGGNSFENAFTIDKIETQTLNHVALANSTGGLASMLDSEFISGVVFRSGDKESSVSSGMSSITDISTYELPEKPVYSVDLGYSGAGFRVSRPLSSNTSLLFSLRESVTNLVSKDIGINGSPEFTNSFTKFTLDPGSRDHVWFDSLSGRDVLKVRPSWNDVFETNAYDTDYSGLRNTTGVVWQHTHQSDAVGTFILSNSENLQNLDQRDQINSNQLLFHQNNHDGVSDAKYVYTNVSKDGSTREAGLDVHMNRVNYNVSQPSGLLSPYSVSDIPQGSFSATPSFTSFDKAAFYDVKQVFGSRAVLSTGIRYEAFGFDYTKLIKAASTSETPSTVPGAFANTGSCCCTVTMSAVNNNAFMPHVSLSLLASRRINLRTSWSRSAQLPPMATLASQPSNACLGLINSQQAVVGATARFGSYVTADVEAYRKTYSGYPVSSLYPQLSLASTLPTVNEPFSLLSMTSDGKGLSQGVELSFRQAPWHHFFTAGNLSLSSARFTGSDGVYRSGIADLPVVLNVTGGITFRSHVVTVRTTATSGRPYTPFLQNESFAQNRYIFDLSEVNALRGTAYSRTDIAVNREVISRGRVLRLHAGLMNIFGRDNFFESLWRPRCPVCGPIKESSMGIQPDFGMSLNF